MTTFQKLKHEARRAEQRSNWARAIDLYRQALDADEDMADLSLFNRIGDLHLRLGQTEEAVACYESAVDRYADSGMLTSAIALCNKILRIAPSRVSVYRRLGSLHARTGLVVEGRANSLRYANHAVEEGRIDDAIAAIEEFTGPTGDEQARIELAELLAERGEEQAAAAQLQAVLRARQSRGIDTGDLRAWIEQLAPDADGVAPTGSPADGKDTDASPTGPLRLATLVAERLGSTGEAPVFQADRMESDEPSDVRVDEALVGVRRVLDAFRAQVRDSLETADPTVRYDLGVEFMTVGLLDEAIEEFQAAVADPSLVEASNARIGECLALRTSGAGFENVRRSSARAPVRPQRPASPSSGEPDEEPTGETMEGPPVESSTAGDVPPAGEVTFVVAPEGGAVRSGEGQSAAGAPDVGDEAGAPEEDELQGHFFRARLAQYRVRRAEERHTVDHAAHLDLGTAYVGMELHQEALRELRVALEGPRAVASRAARVLKRIALADGVPPELALEILARLAEQPSGATAETLGAQLAEAWGDDHPLAERLAEIRARLTEALDELPALEDMFPALDATATDDAEADGEVEPAPESGSPPNVAASPMAEADRLLATGARDRAAELLRATLEDLAAEKRTREGLSVLDRLLEIEPDDAALHGRRVEMAVMTNDRELIIRARTEFGDCLRRLGEAAKARAAYGHVLDVDPHNEAARAAIEAIDAEELERERLEAERREDHEAPSPEEEMAEVEALLDGLGAQDEADEVVVLAPDEDEEAAPHDSDPENVDGPGTADDPTARSRYELGLAFRQMGMWDEAARELRPALRGVADRLAVLEALAECLVRGDRPGEAVSLLRENLRSEEDAEQVGPLYYLGLALAAEGSEAEAREVLARVDAARPGYRDVQARLSELSL